MIDNYDSFTFNIVQYLTELGQKVEVLRNDQITLPEIERLNPSGIVISPGPCTPDKAGISLSIIPFFEKKVADSEPTNPHEPVISAIFI